MRFPLVFSRFKGVAGTALGSDTLPAAMVSAKTHDNVLFSRFTTAQGKPGNRVVVAYKAPSGALALNMTAYVYEDSIGAWFQVATGTLTPGLITFFPTVGLVEPPPGNPELASPGSLQWLLLVTDPGAAPNGEHKFAAGLDLSIPA